MIPHFCGLFQFFLMFFTFFRHSDEYMASPLTDLKIYRKLHTTSKQQTDDADEYTDVASPRELPVVGWQQKGPRRMDCGGRTEREVSPVRTDGLFPRYQGKTCVGTSPRGRIFSPSWVAPQKFSDFCPKGTIGMGPCGRKVFFVCLLSGGPQIRKEQAP